MTFVNADYDEEGEVTKSELGWSAQRHVIDPVDDGVSST